MQCDCNGPSVVAPKARTNCHQTEEATDASRMRKVSSAMKAAKSNHARATAAKDADN